MLAQLKNWLDARTGLSSHVERLTQSPMRQPASYSRSLGALLLALLAIEGLTGILLAFFYSPSATDAWASVYYIERHVSLGSFLRSLHFWGMSALVVVALLHLLVTFWLGAYKKPRELTWMSGILMLLFLFGFSLTGFILRFDQHGLWGSIVETEIARSIPLVGEAQRDVLVGGNAYGNTTLTRMFALHVFVLPGLLIALLLAHIALVRRHGPAPRWWQANTPPQPWFPAQAFKNTLVITASLILIALLALSSDAGLMAPADTTASFNARPEWYFLPLYLLRQAFGSAELIATAVIPGLVLLFLLALPLIDRGEEPHPRARKPYVVTVVLGLVAFTGLVVAGLRADANDADYQRSLESARANAEHAMALADQGGVPLNPHHLHKNDPELWGKMLFDTHCSACHSAGEGQSIQSPHLAGWGSRAWLNAFFDNPNHPLFYGRTSLACKMKPLADYGLDLEQRDALVNGLLAQRGPHAPQGLPKDARAAMYDAFEAGKCASCHNLAVGDRKPENAGALGPELTHYGSPEWIETLLIDPGEHYRDTSDTAMPAFARKLDKAERQALAAFLFSLADVPLPSTELHPAVAQQFDCTQNTTATPDTDPKPAAATTQGGLAAGKALFDEECSACHIVSGEGSQVGPELTGWGSRAWMQAFLANPDHERLYGGTDLEGYMSGIADYDLTEPADIDVVLDTLMLARSGQKLPAVQATLEPRFVQIFTDKSCDGCHYYQATDGTEHGDPEGMGPHLHALGSDPWFHALLADPTAPSHFGEDGGAMPPFTDFTPQQLADLTLYMRSLADMPLPDGWDTAE